MAELIPPKYCPHCNEIIEEDHYTPIHGGYGFFGNTFKGYKPHQCKVTGKTEQFYRDIEGLGDILLTKLKNIPK